ncbi:hypothetical protein [Sellimonas intestinalis]|uniref:hypothetical protein n=1 Tax=Sellimonas intestinalis TaxID=1653434 RepID=UPI003AB33A5E
MYLKLVEMGQLDLLKQVNPYLGKLKVPDGVLGMIRKILGKTEWGEKDYIVLFLKPVKSDTIGLFDELKIYPDKAEEDEDEEMWEDVKDKGKVKRMWSCYKVKLRKSDIRIYIIYSMKKKDRRRKLEL